MSRSLLNRVVRRGFQSVRLIQQKATSHIWAGVAVAAHRIVLHGGRGAEFPASVGRLSEESVSLVGAYPPSEPSSFRSFLVSLISAAATFSSRCCTDEVPGISSMAGERASSQARAI
jgi:hypothetical protein